MPENSSGVRNQKLLRDHALASGVIALAAAVFFLFSEMNFPRELGVLTALAAVFYFTFTGLFGFFCRKGCVRAAGVGLSMMGVLVITLALCYSGGIVSPFIFLYFSMLVAEALYGLQNPFTMPASIAGYLLVVSGHYFGFLPNFMQCSSSYYQNPLAVLVIAAVTVAYIALTGTMSGRIMESMRARLQAEADDRESLVRKLSELNATTQLGVLAHRIAHDIRGPISSVSGYIELRLATEKDPVEIETLRDMQETVDGLVSSLHNITRFGKTSGPTSELLEMRSFFRSLLAIAALAPKARGVEFSVKGGSESIEAEASKADLQQAFFNLIKNAVEAVAENGGDRRIDIILAREGGEVHVSVADNGPGMPEEILSSIFRKSVTTKKSGTGVGLMIARDLLLRNEGDLKLFNRPSGGLEAKVILRAA